MKKKKVTSTDIARKAGVSQSTVSMVLNKKYNVSFSKETIERVEKAAKRAWIRGAETQGQKSGEKGKAFGGILPEPYQSILCDASARG